jgi:hypothetical protein
MSNINYSDTIPAAPSGSTNMKWQFDSNGNVSASLPVASFSTPWTSDMDAATHKLSNVGTISSVAAGAALAFQTPANAATITGAGDATFHSVTAPSVTVTGSAANFQFTSVGGGNLTIQPTGNSQQGNLGLYPSNGSRVSTVSISNSYSTDPNGFSTLLAATEIYIAGRAGLYLWKRGNPATPITRLQIGEYAGSVLTAIDFIFNSTNIMAQVLAPGTFSSAATGAALAFATPSNAATITGAGDATFHNLSLTGGIFSITNLPSVAPAAGSKQLYYDPADGNRVKFAA